MIETEYLEKLEIQYKQTSKIKVLLLYVIYPMALATYFKKALQHRDDVDLLVVGPYTGSWTPWKGGINLPEKYAIPPDIDLPFRPDIGEINYDIVKMKLPVGWIPDLVINVDAGLHWKYRPSDGYVVTIATDPHVLNYDTPRGYSDKFFNMQLCYSKDKDIYLPYAYSQYDHYPEPHTDENGIEQPKDNDAVLIGLQYGHREEWIRELRKRGISVIAENGPVFDEARQLYNRGKIGLNWSSLQDLNARAFELPAMRLAPVMNLVPDIGRFFEQGIHYQGFTNLNEAIERVVWLKEHPIKLNQMANEAYKNVQGHTYDARIDTVLQECGFV